MGKTWKSEPTPSYQKVQILNFGIFDFRHWSPPFWTFSTFCEIFLFWSLPLRLCLSLSCLFQLKMLHSGGWCGGCASCGFKYIFYPSPSQLLQSRSTSTYGRLPPKLVFHWRLSSTEGSLPPKVFFHLRLFSTEGCLPPKVVFHQRSSSAKGCLPPKAVIPQMSSSTEGRLPPKDVCHKRMSPMKVVFY